MIESSSGNFGIALSAYCKESGLKSYCIVDPNISPTNEYLIKTLSTEMIKVTEIDENRGYLLNRIRKVKELQKEIPNSYWINQYENPYNAEAYKETLGKEICDDMNNIDYVFLGVSSGGTITGVSQKVKEIFPNTKIIAVDIDGSVIFGGKSRKRFIPGIGSSMVPSILKEAKIDEVFITNEISTIEMCHELLRSTVFSWVGHRALFIQRSKNILKESYLIKDRMLWQFLLIAEIDILTQYIMIIGVIIFKRKIMKYLDENNIKKLE